MENFEITVNREGLASAYYIGENGVVMFTYQQGENPTIWSQGKPVTGRSEGPLGDAIKVSAAVGMDGQTRIVAFAQGRYYICMQNGLEFSSWSPITQQ